MDNDHLKPKNGSGCRLCWRCRRGGRFRAFCLQAVFCALNI